MSYSEHLDSGLTIDEFDKVWREFSEIQCATYLVIDEDTTKRFKLWRISGDPEDAWS